ncbi:hypothetical protein Aperf_G00000022650 [Anoplocephala perfoliata]
MEDTYFAQNSRENQFSKFVDEIAIEDLVEIPLSSDEENKPDDKSHRAPSYDTKSPLANTQPVISSSSVSKPVIQAFFEPACTPSPKQRNSNKVQDSQDSSHDDAEDDLRLNEDLANSIRHHCSLFSPSLVRAINSDIKEIKRSLNTSSISKRNEETRHKAHKQDLSSERDLLFKCHRHSGGGCNKLTGGQRKRHDQPSRSSFVKRGLNPTKAKMIKSNGSKKEEMTVRQWNFAAPSNTVYSSSEGDNSSNSTAANSDTEDSPVLKSSTAANEIPVEEEEGEWSLQRRPPCPRNPQSIPNRSVNGGSSSANGINCSPDSKDNSTAKSIRHSRERKSQPSLEPDYGSDEDTDQLLDKQYRCDKPVEIPELKEEAEFLSVKKRRGREVAVHHPDFPERLIEGRLYRSRYLGSTQLLCEDHPSKTNRLHQAQEAVQRVKAPDGETQPSVPVELFVSTERVLILNKDLDEIVMDHDLRTISYIADVGSILVLMVRRPHPPVPSVTITANDSPAPSTSTATPSTSSAPLSDESPDTRSPNGTSGEDRTIPSAKIICHLFESDETIVLSITCICDVLISSVRALDRDVSLNRKPPWFSLIKFTKRCFSWIVLTGLAIYAQTQMITQAIGKAFQEAYFEFLRQNGIEDPEAFQERNYQNMIHQQEIFRNELAFFSDKDQEKEVIVPKAKGEALGVVIVESGWGSVLPTAVLANMLPSGPAARCGQLNIGNRIISINGQSLVGLPLATCQSFFKATKNQTAVKLVIVNCSPVVEVLIRRPDQKFQLGFSVQDGVICSLLRGGIAERGGIRVDHRIIEINGESVVAVPHDYIVNLLATAVGEIYIRTMPTSIFRLLTGQETPHYI